MKLTLEALSAPQYAISQNNIQEKFQRAFGKDNEIDAEKKKEERKEKIKKQTANSMQVGVFDMLGTSANDVRAVRKWFRRKENIKHHRLTGRLLVLFLTNKYVCQTTGKVVPQPSYKLVSSNDKLSVLYVLNDLFQRMHKSQIKKNPPKKKQRRYVGDGQISNVSTLSYSNTMHSGTDNIETLVGKRTKTRENSETDNNKYMDSASNQTSAFDYREGWKHIIPKIVVLCCQGLPSQDVASWKRVISVWKTKKILSERTLQQIDDLLDDSTKKRASNVFPNNSSPYERNTTNSINDDVSWQKKRKR